MTAMTETTVTSENASCVTSDNKSKAKNFYRRCKKELREEEYYNESIKHSVEYMDVGAVRMFLDDMFKEGLFSVCSSADFKGNRIEKMSNEFKVSYTLIPGLVYVGDSERSNGCYGMMHCLTEKKRIMTPLTAKVRYNLRTHYELDKMVGLGHLQKFKRDGLVLYLV